MKPLHINTMLSRHESEVQCWEIPTKSRLGVLTHSLLACSTTASRQWCRAKVCCVTSAILTPYNTKPIPHSQSFFCFWKTSKISGIFSPMGPNHGWYEPTHYKHEPKQHSFIATPKKFICQKSTTILKTCTEYCDWIVNMVICLWLQNPIFKTPCLINLYK